MHGASTALRDAAAEFCTGKTDYIAQHPEKRRIGFDIDLPGCSIDLNRDHWRRPPLKKHHFAVLLVQLGGDEGSAAPATQARRCTSFAPLADALIWPALAAAALGPQWTQASEVSPYRPAMIISWQQVRSLLYLLEFVRILRKCWPNARRQLCI